MMAHSCIMYVVLRNACLISRANADDKCYSNDYIPNSDKANAVHRFFLSLGRHETLVRMLSETCGLTAPCYCAGCKIERCGRGLHINHCATRFWI